MTNLIPTCKDCSGDLLIHKHVFSNNTIHCKAWCRECYWSTHLPIENLIFVNSSHEECKWKEMKQKRTKIIKQRKRK